jgi:hypothetical protein
MTVIDIDTPQHNQDWVKGPNGTHAIPGKLDCTVGQANAFYAKGPKTKTLGGAIGPRRVKPGKATRHLKPAAFDPHARDGDGNGIAQQGTTAEHPVDPKEIARAAQVAKRAAGAKHGPVTLHRTVRTDKPVGDDPLKHLDSGSYGRFWHHDPAESRAHAGGGPAVHLAATFDHSDVQDGVRTSPTTHVLPAGATGKLSEVHSTEDGSTWRSHPLPEGTTHIAANPTHKPAEGNEPDGIEAIAAAAKPLAHDTPKPDAPTGHIRLARDPKDYSEDSADPIPWEDDVVKKYGPLDTHEQQAAALGVAFPRAHQDMVAPPENFYGDPAEDAVFTFLYNEARKGMTIGLLHQADEYPETAKLIKQIQLNGDLHTMGLTNWVETPNDFLEPKEGASAVAAHEFGHVLHMTAQLKAMNVEPKDVASLNAADVAAKMGNALPAMPARVQERLAQTPAEPFVITMANSRAGLQSVVGPEDAKSLEGLYDLSEYSKTNRSEAIAEGFALLQLRPDTLSKDERDSLGRLAAKAEMAAPGMKVAPMDENVHGISYRISAPWPGSADKGQPGDTTNPDGTITPVDPDLLKALKVRPRHLPQRAQVSMATRIKAELKANPQT